MRSRQEPRHQGVLRTRRWRLLLMARTSLNRRSRTDDGVIYPAAAQGMFIDRGKPCRGSWQGTAVPDEAFRPRCTDSKTGWDSAMDLTTRDVTTSGEYTHTVRPDPVPENSVCARGRNG